MRRKYLLSELPIMYEALVHSYRYLRMNINDKINYKGNICKSKRLISMLKNYNN
jgi:hypothetical protein